MAIRKVIESDLSGKLDAHTITFGLGDTWYEVDLTREEEKDLQKVLQTYLKAGRQVQDETEPQRRRHAPETTREERDQIRKWAAEQGIELAAAGRIPKRVIKQYDDAHGIDREMPFPVEANERRWD